MQRYSVLPSQMHPEEYDPDKVLFPHFSGDWVRYEDAQAALGAERQRAEQAEADFEKAAKTAATRTEERNEARKAALEEAEQAVIRAGSSYTAANDIQIIAWAAEAVRQRMEEER